MTLVTHLNQCDLTFYMEVFLRPPFIISISSCPAGWLGISMLLASYVDVLPCVSGIGFVLWRVCASVCVCVCVRPSASHIYISVLACNGCQFVSYSV